MSYTLEDEREAHIENMKANTEFTHRQIGLLKYEPWKVVMTAFGAGAAVILALIALLTYMHH